MLAAFEDVFSNRERRQLRIDIIADQRDEISREPIVHLQLKASDD